MEKIFVIGLDIGTSSLKLIILNILTNELILELKKSTECSKVFLENKLYNEQNPNTIIELVENLIKDIPSNIFNRIKGWQLCGQV